MKIGVIGSGNMGRTLGLAWAERGHDVFFGARDPARAEAVARMSASARYGTNDEAAAHGEVLLWTVRDAPEAVERSLAGAIVIDCNNGPMPKDGGFGLASGTLSHA